jgi:hypothetical protein
MAARDKALSRASFHGQAIRRCKALPADTEELESARLSADGFDSRAGNSLRVRNGNAIGNASVPYGAEQDPHAFQPRNYTTRNNSRGGVCRPLTRRFVVYYCSAVYKRCSL